MSLLRPPVHNKILIVRTGARVIALAALGDAVVIVGGYRDDVRKSDQVWRFDR